MVCCVRSVFSILEVNMVCCVRSVFSILEVDIVCCVRSVFSILEVNTVCCVRSVFSILEVDIKCGEISYIKDNIWHLHSWSTDRFFNPFSPRALSLNE